MFRKYHIFLLFALFSQIHCNNFNFKEFEEKYLKNQNRHEIPIGNIATIYGSASEGKYGVQADLIKRPDGKLTGEVYRIVNPSSKGIGGGGSLSWTSDTFQAKLKTERNQGLDSSLTAKGEGVLWRLNKNIELTGFLDAMINFFYGKPNIKAGLNLKYNS